MLDEHIQTIVLMKQCGYCSDMSEKELLSLSPDEFIEKTKSYDIYTHLPNVYDSTKTSEANIDKIKQQVINYQTRLNSQVLELNEFVNKQVKKLLKSTHAQEGNAPEQLEIILAKIDAFFTKLKSKLYLPTDKIGDKVKKAYAELIIDEWFSQNSDHVSNFVQASIRWLYMNKAIFQLMRYVNSEDRKPLSLVHMVQKFYEEGALTDGLQLLIQLRYFNILNDLQNVRCRLVGIPRSNKIAFFPVHAFGQLTNLLISDVACLRPVITSYLSENKLFFYQNKLVEQIFHKNSANMNASIKAINHFIGRANKGVPDKNGINEADEVYYVSALQFLEEYPTNKRPFFSHRLTRQITFSLQLEQPAKETILESSSSRLKK